MSSISKINLSDTDYTLNASSISDYNSSTAKIQVGFAGAGLTASTLGYVAGYTTDGTKIKDVNKAQMKSWLGLGSAAYANLNTLDTYETYLVWGGKNTNRDISPMGMAISSEHNANRLAFINGNAITVEYTTDGGTTWIDSGLSATEKTKLFTTNNILSVGIASGAYSVNAKTRVTINAATTSVSYVYTTPRKLLIEMACAHASMKVLIEYKTGAATTWSTYGTYSLGGNSSWNEIPLILGTLGGYTSQNYNIWNLRFTFYITDIQSNPSYVTSFIRYIRLFGTNDWISASKVSGKGPMSSTGHLYSYDIDANATFPGFLTASKFVKSGGKSSQFLKADGSVDSNSYSTTSHTHTKSQITDFPASLKNPTSLTVKLNSGTTEGTNLFTYDGSAAKTVNITPSAIGAATSGHTHSTYFPYSGGTFTGPISFNTSSLPKFSGAPPFIVGIEAFADGGILKWADADAVKVGTATTSSYSSYLGNSSTNYSYSTLKSALDGKSSTSHTHGYVSTVKVGTTSYPVSSNTITLPAYPTASSLGLSSAMKFIGTTTTALTDGATTNTITIGSTSVTATSGNVVLYGNKEFLWNGSTGKWEELGDESSHALKTVSIKAGTGLSGGGTLEADRTLSLNTAGTDTLGGIKTGYTTSGKNYKVQLDSNNNAYVNVPWTDNNTTYSAGTGLTLSGTSFSLNTAGSTLGGVKTTSTVTSNSGYTACPIIGGIPYYKDTNTTYNFSGYTFYSSNSNNPQDCDNCTTNGVYYYKSNGPSGITAGDGALYTQAYSTSWVGQIAQDYRSGHLFLRGKNNGKWTDWLTNCDSSNTYISNGTVYINGNSIKPVTSETSLSKGTTSGSGNAVTDISVSGHKITLTKDTTFLTAHQDISGKSNTSHTHSVKINGTTKTIAASGGTAVDLGTYLTAHQDISGKADKASITAGTAGTSSATSGSSLSVPYVTVNTQGIVTGYGTHKHTISGFAASSHTHSYLPLSGGAMSGSIHSIFTSNQWVNSLTNSVITLDHAGYSGWICGPTKDGRISISTYADSTGGDNKLYFGWGETGRTENSFASQMWWNGASNVLCAGTFINTNGTEVSYSGHTHSVKINGTTKTIAASGGTAVDLGTYLTAHQDISGKQDKSTAVTHTASTAVGSSTKPVYIASDGTATAIGYTIAKSVPSNAVFTDTNTNQTIKGNGTGFGSTAAIDIVGSGATTVTADTTNNKITISSTNTTYTAGTNVTISGTTISAKDTVYSLPTASSSTLGGIKVGSNLSIDSNGVLSGTANTTYSAFKGASASAAGTSGLVPAPASGKNTSFLRGDGTWVVPTDTNTTYSAGDGLTLSGTKFSNSGVRSISTGTTNGTISVNTGGTTGNVAVKGLGSAAYTASSAYATASHTHSYLPLSGGTMTGKIYRNYASASAVPFIHIGANNVDATMLRVYSSDGTETSNYNSLYGYSLIYRGSGSGINNRLDLMADNQTSTQVTAISVNNQGDVGIKTTPTQNVPLTVNGSISATRLTRTGNGSYWYAGRTSALVRTTSVASDGWNVITSLKTKNGDWSTGVLGSTDKLEFCYTTDTDFNAGPDTNVTMHALSLDNAGNLTTNGSTTSSKFIKSGGTSSQFLKADGSVDSNSYSTTSHTHSYLPLSGGTITNSNFAPLSIQRSGSTYAAAIKFENSNGTLGYLGITGSANSSLKRWENDANTSHTICDDSNTYISSGTVYINGNSIKPLTSETSLSKGTTSGSGNAVTDISVSGHKITLTKDTTFLTAHQDISGKSNTSHTHSVKINGTTKTIAASGGTAVDLGTYLTSIPTASSSTLGGIKVGSNLSISSDGTLSATNTNTWRPVVDNLTSSTSTTSSLSAKQGYLLANGSAKDNNAIASLSASGTTITYTKRDGTTDTITTQDTHYKSTNVVTNSGTSTTNTSTALTNGNVYLNHVEDLTNLASSHKISGTGATTVTTDTKGNILINSTNTNTHYASSTIVSNAATGTGNASTSISNGKVYLNHIENGAVKSSHLIKGSGATTVTANSSNQIIISSTNTNTTYSANGLNKLSGTTMYGNGVIPAIFMSPLAAVNVCLCEHLVQMINYGVIEAAYGDTLCTDLYLYMEPISDNGGTGAIKAINSTSSTALANQLQTITNRLDSLYGDGAIRPRTFTIHFYLYSASTNAQRIPVLIGYNDASETTALLFTTITEWLPGYYQIKFMYSDSRTAYFVNTKGSLESGGCLGAESPSRLWQIHISRFM